MNLDDHIKKKNKRERKKISVKTISTQNYDYNINDIKKTIKKLGIRKGDNIFLSSNITFFGLTAAKNKDDLCQMFLNCFLKAIGKNGTLCVPTYSYSFGQKKIYNTKTTPSDCGILSEYLRTHKLAKNYLDPNVSISIFGKKSKTFTNYVTENSYGENSFFDKFFRANGKICNLNLPAETCFVHYFERKLKVSYRFDKKFEGIIINNKKRLKKTSFLFVRKLENGTEGDYAALSGAMVKYRILKKENLGRGFAICYKLKDQYDLLKKIIKKDKFFLTKKRKKNFKSFTNFTFY